MNVYCVWFLEFFISFLNQLLGKNCYLYYCLRFFFFWCNFQILLTKYRFLVENSKELARLHGQNCELPIEWKIQWLFGKCVRHTMNTIQLLLGIFNPLYNLNAYSLRFFFIIYFISFCHCGWVTQVELCGCHI